MVNDVNVRSDKPRTTHPVFAAIDEDHAVVGEILAGNTEAYRDLVRKYQGPVFNLLLRMLHNRAEAEELTQDVFVRAYEFLPRFFCLRKNLIPADFRKEIFGNSAD